MLITMLFLNLACNFRLWRRLTWSFITALEEFLTPIGMQWWSLSSKMAGLWLLLSQQTPQLFSLVFPPRKILWSSTSSTLAWCRILLRGSFKKTALQQLAGTSTFSRWKVASHTLMMKIWMGHATEVNTGLMVPSKHQHRKSTCAQELPLLHLLCIQGSLQLKCLSLLFR